MKHSLLLGMAACILGMMMGCKPEPIEPPTPQPAWPKPLNRTGYVVEKITWYQSETNHREATYEYDENNRLIKRTEIGTYIEGGSLKTAVNIDSLVYQDGQLSRIITDNDDFFLHPDRLFYYDDQAKLIRVEEGNSITCFAYRNGLMDSVYSPNNPEIYTTLEYDAAGNIVKAHERLEEYNLIGEPTGIYYIKTFDFEYDEAPRPNFNLDNAFLYEPVFGQGTTYPTYVRMLSPHNMTRYSEGPEIWEYEYNEQGLPASMYHQFSDIVPTNHPTFLFVYRQLD